MNGGSATKKTAKGPSKGPLHWIFVSIGGLLAVVLVGWLGLNYLANSFFASRNMDLAELQDNPLLMAAQLRALDPDVEVVDVDQATSRVTFRSKSTGEETVMALDSARNSLVTVENAAVSASSRPLPGWLNAYPGTTPQNIQNQETATGALRFSFQTDDTPSEVADFFEQQIGKAGLDLIDRTVNPDGAFLLARGADNTRELMITINAAGNVDLRVLDTALVSMPPTGMPETGP